MTIRLRRVLSWLVTLGLLLIVASGLSYLPGAGGLLDELRWLLARPGTTRVMNQATGLLLLAEQRTPGARPAALTALLRDHHPQVVRNAVVLVADELGRTAAAGPAAAEFETLRASFEEWYGSLTTGQHHKYRIPTATVRVLDEVLGPDWRERCARGGTTRR